MPKQKVLSIVLASVMVLEPVGSLISSVRAAAEPYERTFIVTAYYSPLPDQSFYVTGSYAKDIRLNGNGTNGADGTPVYPGMIAAPGTYAFGTQINCPPYINGVIHDRGGAIVKAGTRNNTHDRLDFWAGEGEEALKTALYWGKRTLTCTVYPAGASDVQQYVKLPKGNADDIFRSFVKKIGNAVAAQPMSESIPEKYRTLLSRLGYDPDDAASRIAFQVRHRIIASEKDPAAGHVGQQTKATLDRIATEIASKVPRENLEEGDVDPEVRKLQEILVQLGYMKDQPTAIFGSKTKEALIAFQLEKGLIDSRQHPAAGFVGPGTHQALTEAAAADTRISGADRELIAHLNAGSIREKAIAESQALAENKPEFGQSNAGPETDQYRNMLEELSREWIEEHNSDEQESGQPAIQLAGFETNKDFMEIKEKLTAIVEPFDKTLSLGAKHEDVRKIQLLLKANDYYHGEIITDYFGEQTRQAIAKFQVDTNIIASIHSPGAGVIGPKTLKALNDYYFQQEFSITRTATAKIRAPAVHPNDLKPLQQASLPVRQAGTPSTLQ